MVKSRRNLQIMARITEELVRKRAEHNEGMLGSLEELSLHMLHVERIEHLDRWCRNLKILLLHNNVIPKIENVGRLKKLEYLNLSLNIVERVENLEGCESLNKLDLTLNFIGELTSIESLAGNYNLRQLTLVGNPCSKFEGYRSFVVHTLAQLEELDGKKVERTERIVAAQDMALGLRDSILEQQRHYQELRSQQKMRAPPSLEERLEGEKGEGETEEDQIKRIWSEPSEHSPEVRVLMSQLSLRQAAARDAKPAPPPKPPRRLHNKDGRPLNINEAQLEFSLTEEDKENCLVLKLQLNRSLDTSQMTTDVHPDHVRVEVKGQIFQLCLLEEVRPDVATAERSLASGCLVITMPLAKEHIIKAEKNNSKNKKNMTTTEQATGNSKRQMLEIGGEDRDLDFSRIVKHMGDSADLFVDDPDVPPLELID